jgi:protein-tyrosine phosphatase
MTVTSATHSPAKGADMIDRVHAYESVHNFRDYGGYQAADGRMRTGVLWRSGQHGMATDDDLARIAKLDIRTVIDLRGDGERRYLPCRRVPGFAGEVLFCPGETAGSELAPHEQAGQGLRTAAEVHAAMLQIYAGIPFRPALIGSLRLYFEALATREGASLLHCAAGKDRTGVAVAILHILLGVHHDDMLADYLLTMTAMDPLARLPSARDPIRERYGSLLEDEAMLVLMGVQEQFLDTAFAAIAERYGSVERYAEEVLGVDQARRRALALRLVA